MSNEKFDFIIDDNNLGLKIASIALLGLVMIPICIGSFSSLRTMKNYQTTITKRTRSQSTNSFEDTDDEGKEKYHVLTIKDAFLFPFICSAVLYTAYLTFNEIQPHYINQAIQVITFILSCAVFSNTVILIAKNQLPFKLINKIEKYKFSFSKRDQRLYHVNVTKIHLLVLIVSVGLAVTYNLTQHWIIGNLFAISLAINAIGSFTVDSFGTGYLLLLGMLAYDIVWFFSTDIILNISNVIAHDALTSIIWPRNIDAHIHDKLLKSPNQYFTMFGLGDIIVPGIFIAYCLRFDKLNSLKKASNKKNIDNITSKDFPKPYFVSTMLAYAISAGTSIYTVHFTKKAQSALLFIVPALIVSSLVTAFIQNKLLACNCNDILKTTNKLSSFSSDEQDLDDDDDERPVRFQKINSTRGKSTRGRRSTSAARGARSVSKGTRGRSKSRTVAPKTSARSESKEVPVEFIIQHAKKDFEAKKDRTIAQDVIEEHSTPKTVGRKRGRNSINKNTKVL